MRNHAPYAIMGDLVILYGKTTKTACGKRCKTDKLVSRDKTDCDGCITQIKTDRFELSEMIRIAHELGLME